MKRDQNTGRVQLIGIKRRLTRALARSVVFAQRSLFRPHTRPSFPPAAFLHHTQSRLELPAVPSLANARSYGLAWCPVWTLCLLDGLLVHMVPCACPPAVVLASRRPLANGNDKRRVWRVTRHSWAKLPDLG